jgi:hypothetical protein
MTSPLVNYPTKNPTFYLPIPTFVFQHSSQPPAREISANMQPGYDMRTVRKKIEQLYSVRRNLALMINSLLFS